MTHDLYSNTAIAYTIGDVLELVKHGGLGSDSRVPAAPEELLEFDACRRLGGLAERDAVRHSE